MHINVARIEFRRVWSTRDVSLGSTPHHLLHSTHSINTISRYKRSSWINVSFLDASEFRVLYHDADSG